MTHRIATKFSRLSDSELSQKFRYIITSITGNVSFPTPDPSLSYLTELADEFDLAVSKAEDRSLKAIAWKNEKRSEAVFHFKQLALYIGTRAMGNETVLLSSGFSLAKGDAGPIGELPKPEGFAVKAQSPGSVKLKLDSIHGADSYLYEYKLPEKETWTVIAGTKATITISNLTSGLAYQFRVAGIGSDDARTYSDVITSYIL